MSVPAPPPQDLRRRRHSAQTMNRAREMAAAGWTATQIRRYLERNHGIVVSRSTIYYWIDPEEAARCRRIQRSAETRARRGRRDDQGTAETRYKRLLQLRDAGLTFTGCTVIARVDFGLAMTSEEMRHLLQAPRLSPRLVARLEERSA